jgi:hypothetical protein
MHGVERGQLSRTGGGVSSARDCLCGIKIVGSHYIWKQVRSRRFIDYPRNGKRL